MNARKIIIMLGILTTNLVSSTCVAEEWPNMIEPPNSYVVWVGDDVVQNGVPMKMKKFKSELEVDDIINYYRSQWQGLAKYNPVENKFKDWNIIGIQSGDFYLTVQAKTSEETESEGFISVSKIALVASGEIQLDIGTDFPFLDGSEVISNTDSNDIGSSAKTIIFKNSYSVQSNVSFYQAEMSSDGWDLMREDEHPEDGSSTKFMYFQKSKKAFLITINSNDYGETVVVANQIKY